MSERAPAPATRREVITGGVLAGLGMLLPLGAAAAPSREPLITRKVPAGGAELPAVGIGADAFRADVSEEIRAELKRMNELGGTVIDTAAAYGDSEAIIGQALEALGLRDKMFLATKLIGNGAAESFERSLQRLRTRRIDLLQVHNLSGIADAVPQMQQWKKAGTIRYIGATTSRGGQHEELMSAMRSYPLDFIQVDYSLGNREAAAAVLPLAIERRQAVLVNLPFGRSSLFEQAAGRKLPEWVSEIDVSSWGQYFLKYVISHPAVTCVIPGSTKVSHLEDNQGAGRGRLPDAAMRRRMEAYWDNKS
jgi:aryl-alcohol dehydrogenase-like predicted oxidoreductase